MHFNANKSCLLAIIFTNIRGSSLPSTLKPRFEEDGTKTCLSNYQLNGDVCTECPAGYYDVNCSVPCPPPTYGSNCAEQCSCSSISCHHVYGCNVTADCPVGYYGDNCSFSCLAPTNGNSCAEKCSCSNASCQYVHGCNLTTECRDEYGGQQNCSKHIFTKNPGTPSNEEEKEENDHIVSKYIKILIITFGILTLTLLLLLITREIYKLCRNSAQRGNHQNPPHTPGMDDIYTSITEC
uniref:Protein draper-like n=1 Tax=Crassostrea virginica TaxID=6565 RepID=A0A8B8BI90_CRAVI|nr:protein draper-like [Crassostrea virginica]